MPIPDTARRQLERNLNLHCHNRWPHLDTLDIRYRAPFAYITAIDTDGDPLPLCPLRYHGTAKMWGFAIYLPSNAGYEKAILPSGDFTGTPEQALDCACGLSLNAAWTDHI